jgi:hypothetical protein
MLHTHMSRARMRIFVVLALRGAVLGRSLYRILMHKQRKQHKLLGFLRLLDTNEAGRKCIKIKISKQDKFT